VSPLAFGYNQNKKRRIKPLTGFGVGDIIDNIGRDGLKALTLRFASSLALMVWISKEVLHVHCLCFSIHARV